MLIEIMVRVKMPPKIIPTISVIVKKGVSGSGIVTRDNSNGKCKTDIESIVSFKITELVNTYIKPYLYL